MGCLQAGPGGETHAHLLGIDYVEDGEVRDVLLLECTVHGPQGRLGGQQCLGRQRVAELGGDLTLPGGVSSCSRGVPPRLAVSLLSSRPHAERYRLRFSPEWLEAERAV